MIPDRDRNGRIAIYAWIALIPLVALLGAASRW